MAWIRSGTATSMGDVADEWSRRRREQHDLSTAILPAGTAHR
nr:hypothetical protein [Paraburkholderia ginsengisoli]